MTLNQTFQTAACVAAVAFACVTHAPMASAQVVASGALCTGLGIQTYAPAITGTPTDTTFNGSGTFSCATTSVPQMSNGTFTVTGEGVFSCLGVTSFIGRLEMNWVDADNNVIATSTSPLNTLGVNLPTGSLLAAKGVIDGGPFESNKATVILPGLTLQLFGCILGGGIRSTGAPLFLGISSAI